MTTLYCVICHEITVCSVCNPPPPPPPEPPDSEVVRYLGVKLETHPAEVVDNTPPATVRKIEMALIKRLDASGWLTIDVAGSGATRLLRGKAFLQRMLAEWERMGRDGMFTPDEKAAFFEEIRNFLAAEKFLPNI